jgi:hypothetical protein
MDIVTSRIFHIPGERFIQAHGPASHSVENRREVIKGYYIVPKVTIEVTMPIAGGG